MRPESSWPLILKGDLSIEFKKPDAWTLCPIFEKDFIMAGTHSLPLFKGGPSPDIFNIMKEKGLNNDILKLLTTARRDQPPMMQVIKI